jgi:hypothetical protein
MLRSSVQQRENRGHRHRGRALSGLCAIGLAAGMTRAALPAMAAGPYYEVAFQASNDSLWTVGAVDHGTLESRDHAHRAVHQREHHQPRPRRL